MPRSRQYRIACQKIASFGRRIWCSRRLAPPQKYAVSLYAGKIPVAIGSPSWRDGRGAAAGARSARGTAISARTRSTPYGGTSDWRANTLDELSVVLVRERAPVACSTVTPTFSPLRSARRQALDIRPKIASSSSARSTSNVRVGSAA